MSASQLVISQNHSLDFFDFTDSKGIHRTFATCGSITMYVSPNAKAELEKEDANLDNLRYAECCKEGEDNWVPCLMTVGTANKPKKSLGLSLLRK